MSEIEELDPGRGRRGGPSSVRRIAAVLAAAMLALSACSSPASQTAGSPAAASRRPSAGSGPRAVRGASRGGAASTGAASAAAQPPVQPSPPGGAPAGGTPSGATPSGARAAAASSNATTAGNVAAARPGTVVPQICVPFRHVLGFEARKAVLAERSSAEQQAANRSLREALAQLTSTLHGVAPAAVTGAIADLRREAVVVTAQPVSGGAAHARGDVLALRRYLERTCGGEPGTAGQEAGIRGAVAVWLPATGSRTGCFSVADIRVSRVDPSYGTADLVPSCQVPGGGTALLHKATDGVWKVVGLEQGIPCGQAPSPALADLFGAVVPTLCGTSPKGTARVVAVRIDGSEPGTTLTGSYPQIAGLSGAGVQSTINGVLQRAVSDAETSFAREVAATGGNGTLTLSYQVGYLKEPYVSLRLDLLRSVAGTAHPSGTVATFTFDLRSGYRYRLADLFRPGADYPGFLAAAARSQLDARYGPGTWKTIAPGGGGRLFDAWLLTGKGLAVTFNGAPSVLGQPTATIPYTDPVLASLARPYALPSSSG